MAHRNRCFLMIYQENSMVILQFAFLKCSLKVQGSKVGNCGVSLRGHDVGMWKPFAKIYLTGCLPSCFIH